MSMGKQLDYIKSLVFGGGYVPPPSAGARGDAPGVPLAAFGTYEFVQPSFFNGVGARAASIPVVAPVWQDWGQYSVAGSDQGGFFGGGIDPGLQTAFNQEANLFFDTDTGIYYNIG